ncbi:hypothetical protein [Actinomadura litoris]|uniref:hypothetical protein n=1 Tax=Actinomadura litoris TaxID=2678616 RepID=UPI001FA7F18F|nr:hypothetical protein [Actinomadura litoris]
MANLDRHSLSDSARDFTGRALRAYLDGDERVILTNAAIAMEHLSKAYLADIHPGLLMEIRNGSIDSLLHLLGHGDRARKLPFPKTIGGKEALLRVEHLLPALKAPKDALAQLVAVRDGVVHTGFLDATSTRVTLTAFLRYATELFDELGQEEDERWGKHTELVAQLITESLTEIEHEVHRKIFAARQRLATLVEEIPESEQGEVGDLRQVHRRRRLAQGMFSEDFKCPACRHPGAQVQGPVEIDWDVEEDRKGPSLYVKDFIFRPERLDCGACELCLVSADELRAAGLPEAWSFQCNVDRRIDELVDPLRLSAEELMDPVYSPDEDGRTTSSQGSVGLPERGHL